MVLMFQNWNNFLNGFSRPMHPIDRIQSNMREFGGNYLVMVVLSLGSFFLGLPMIFIGMLSLIVLHSIFRERTNPGHTGSLFKSFFRDAKIGMGAPRTVGEQLKHGVDAVATDVKFAGQRTY